MDKTQKPTPISRRTSLKRAAGALALGLGAPMTALAATGESDKASNVLAFYKLGARSFVFDGKGNDLIATIEVPDEIAEMLMGREAFGFLKLGDIKGERGQVFEVRPRRG